MKIIHTADLHLKGYEDERWNALLNLNDKSMCANIVGEQEAVLKYSLGKENDILEENLRYWRQKVEEIKVFKHKAVHIDFNEKRLAELKEIEAEFGKDVENIKKSLIFIKVSCLKLKKKQIMSFISSKVEISISLAVHQLI